jgi:Holliday junction resolvase-like predicted endonuclease
MSKASRDKGRRGQREAQALLQSRDWTTAELNAGTAVEDMIATNPDGQAWAVEVKNTVAITTAHRAQAMAQAKARRLPWMLLSKIAGTSSWLVQRQNQRPAVWHEGNEQ